MEKSKCGSKKGDKQVSRNYQPVLLLPIYVKIFECLLYNNFFEFFIKNNLILSNRPDFKQFDSFISQSLSITHDFTAI